VGWELVISVATMAAEASLSSEKAQFLNLQRFPRGVYGTTAFEEDFICYRTLDLHSERSSKHRLWQ